MPAPSWRMLITKRARKDLDKLPKPLRRRIRNKLVWFESRSNPLTFAERLTKPADGDYRWRVGQYRVILVAKGKKLYIMRVQHRKDVYRK